MRPYNSLPRGQDVNNYPSLTAHQTRSKNDIKDTRSAATATTCVKTRKHSPARRAHSEDIYAERKSEGTQTQIEEIIEKSMDTEKGE